MNTNENQVVMIGDYKIPYASFVELLKQRVLCDTDILCERYKTYQQAGLMPPSTETSDHSVVSDQVSPEFMPVLWVLAAAFRLKRWEETGITNRLEAGLPLSSEVFRMLGDYAVDNSQPIPLDLPWRMLEVWIRHMAWNSIGGGDADILIDDHADDQWLEAMADLLWQFRHLALQSGAQN